MLLTRVFRAIFMFLLCLVPLEALLAADTDLLETARWIQTGEGNSLVPTTGIFTFRPRREQVRTTATEVNIHAHHRALRVRRARRITYSGRMRVVDENGGVGVTFLSQYPSADVYYRLRRYSGNTFHIAPHGTEITEGEIDTGVTPVAGVWYSFKVLINVQRVRTRIRAKMWPSIAREPRSFSVDCSDTSETRLRRGRFGIWAMGDGEKRWASLRVRS